MGTSSNQRSPRTPSWNAVLQVLGNTSVPVELQSREIWRAASADRNQQLAPDLSSPFLVHATALAESTTSPVEAAAAFDSSLADAGVGNFFLDLAKRALVRAVAAGEGAHGFASELFAETAGYYASRDMPSIVGATGCVGSARDALALNDNIRGIARNTASAISREILFMPRGAAISPTAWASFVSQVLAALQKRGLR